MSDPLKAPFPAFGGKSRVADLVWSRLGDVSNFIEPFCFSAALLLRRPHAPRIETLNDANNFVANFWRAIQRDPEAVAVHADWPVNEADLHARHRWLVLSEAAAAFREHMRTDPEYYDPKVAGWWCWGACCWIGSGWCDTPDSAAWSQCTHMGDAGRGVHANVSGETMPTAEQCRTGGKGVNGVGPDLSHKKPRLVSGHDGHGGQGVHAQGPEPDTHAKRPRVPSSVGGWMPGVLAPTEPSDAHRPQLADAYARGRGVHGHDAAGTCAARRAWLIDWFARLADRLRTVRVCCGHWLRVCDSPSVTTRLGRTGIFLDPPYALDLARMHAWVRHLAGDGPAPEAAGAATSRSGSLYANDKAQDVDRLVAEVHRYCAERGADPRMRLALCGYAGEHEALEALGWECVPWKASGGYRARSATGQANAARERLWFSPHCVRDGGKMPLFHRSSDSLLESTEG